MTSSTVSNIYVEVAASRVYRRLAQLRIAESLALNATKIFGSLAGVFGLVGSIFLANGVANLLGKPANKEPKNAKGGRNGGKRKQYYIIKKYKSFIIFQFPSQCVSLIVSFFPVFYFMAFSTAESLGLLSLAITITNIPIHTVGQSISQYVISENGRSDDLRSLFRLLVFIITILFLLAIPVFYFLSDISFFIVNKFFDERWVKSTNYIVAFSYLGFMRIITMAVVNICNIINYQKFQLWLNCAVLLSAIGAVLLSASEQEFINLFVTGSCFVLALANCHLMLLLSRIKNEKNYVRW